MADTFDYTPQFLTKNGSPWFPIMGEIHYSRVPADTWKEELLKMKAGGVTIVSAYTIWIHHEEIEGAWDFTCCRDLRRFVELVQECGMYMLLRIGPWCHGEVRNGGFPDWLLRKGFEPRTNDERYFAEVKKWYAKIYEQVSGLLLKDGGPIIGVQIENEFGHCGGLTGEEGEKHMKRLLAMAKAEGFTVPLYTATGWGGAVTAGMLPVMGGYVDAPWDPRTTEIEPSGNYVITYERNDHAIGSDFGLGEGITFDMKKFPYLTAELGGGLEPTFKRRPVPLASDIGAETLVKLASGVNLLGYYMYHGGTNPKGRLSTLQESKATGSLNDLPELSYDFFAPLGEYGRANPVYGELKLYSLFAEDFGSDLCRMNAVIPADNPSDPEDTRHVRWSWRSDGNSGYLFINNYVRRRKMAEHRAQKFSFTPSEGAGEVSFTLDISSGDYCFLPFNMKIGDAVLEKAYVSPLCILHNEKPVYVFYRTPASAGKHETDLYQFRNGKAPTDAEIYTISRRDAEHAYKIRHGGKEYLVITGDELVCDGDKVFLIGTGNGSCTVYPGLPLLHAPVTAQKADTAVKLVSETEKTKTYELTAGTWSGNDCFLSIYYSGTCARLYENGKLADDNLFCGRNIPFMIGLKRFSSGTPVTFRLEIDALGEHDDIYIEDRPAFTGGKACDIGRIETEAEYKIRIL
jgi:beta-galactosidase